MPRKVFRIVPVFVFAVLAAGAGCGCGSSHFDVTGRVTYNGSPLNKPDGMIVFVGADESQVAASIGADGTYRAAKVPAGPNRIAVYYPNPEARSGKRFPSRTKNAEPPAAGSPAPSPFLTPARFASVTTSDLSAKVEAGTVFDVDLTGPPIP